MTGTNGTLPMTGNADPVLPHLENTEVAAYLDKVLSPADRSRVEGHLADCAECRAEVREVAQVLGSRTVPRRWIVIGTMAAAAVVAGLLLAPGARVRTEAGGAPRFREGAEGVPAIAVVAPGESTAVAAEAVVFTWRAAAAEAHYQVRVLDATGGVVWTVETHDTTVSLPRTVTLERAGAYFWYVDALLADGGTATSGAHSFRVMR